MSAAYYSLKEGRPLLREEAISNSSANGGFVVYIPNDKNSPKWKEEAINQLTGAGLSNTAGLTVQQMYHTQSAAKDTSCISARPTEAKVAYLKIVGANLAKNTPSPHEDEDCRLFVMRGAQRDLSENEVIKQRPANKKRKKDKIANQHQLELDFKKWGKDVESEFKKEMEKTLPSDPTKDDEEEKEFRALLQEHEASKMASQPSGKQNKARRNRICGSGLGQFKEVVVTESGATSCNCQHCMTDGYCFDTMIYNLVVNNTTPPLKCYDVNGIPWDRVRAKWTEQLKTTLFEEEDEHSHKDAMLKEYLPPVDPCFHHVAKVESVPAPWSPKLGFQISKDGTQLKVCNKEHTCRAKVLDGDVILKIGHLQLADDDGSLKASYAGMTLNEIAEEIGNLSHKEIALVDVLRWYRSERVARCTTLTTETMEQVQE